LNDIGLLRDSLAELVEPGFGPVRPRQKTRFDSS
jgi:hypothetical protein